jgi:two-component system phosphate regulon sensor histidine kinase PhoR
MRRRKLLWYIFPSYLFIILIVVAAATWVGLGNFRTFYLQQAERDLAARAQLAVLQAEPRLPGLDLQAGHSLAKSLGKNADARVTIIRADGVVLGDSQSDARHMDNHRRRPEVLAALAGGTGVSRRYSRTLNKTMLYIARPLRHNGGVAGVLRLAVPQRTLNDALRASFLTILFWSAMAAAGAALASLFVARRITGPLETLRQGAARYAHGNLDRRLPLPHSEELASLAQAMNHMAAQLDNRIRTIVQQRNELEALLAGMMEGVLAVDPDNRLIKINSAAALLLGVTAVDVQGRALNEVVRNTDLQRFVARTLKSTQPVQGEIVLHHDRDRFLQAHGSVLRDDEWRSIGAVVVLNDITHLKRLENVRRDFVANVSHELKTPITSIKGFVETLQDGAIGNEQDARRFLDIIERHADRLNAIIDDLLSLSRIEQETDRETIATQPGPLKPVLQAAMRDCDTRAAAKSIEIKLDCPDAMAAHINSRLLEQAIGNLIDNAIKYSEPETQIQVQAQEHGGDILIHVRDQGRGIPAEHLERIFERFYRVDKARSRKMGGTGLGLAIVKHIAQAHGGLATVTSEPGRGSTFTIRLQKA